MNRRTFLRVASRLVAALWGASFLWGWLRYLTPREGLTWGRMWTPVLDLDELPVGEARQVNIGEHPVLLIRVKPDAVVALSAVCTHRRCGVVWNRDQEALTCPCHGGRFALSGQVLAGPPPSPLRRYAVHLQNGKIFLSGGPG